MIVLSLLVVISMFRFLFTRYFPISGLAYVDKKKIEFTPILFIDLRDYNEAYKDPIDSGMNIPIAYLKRYYRDIPKKDLVVIASNCMERNVGVRILRRKGFKVIGYSIPSLKKLTGKKKQIKTESYC